MSFTSDKKFINLMNNLYTEVFIHAFNIKICCKNIICELNLFYFSNQNV